MKGQQPFPTVEGLAPPPAPTNCLWCQSPATAMVEIEPPIMTTKNRAKVMTKKPITQPACTPCARRIEERKAKVAEEKAEARRRGPLG